jgi:hypothetical protein
MRWLALLVLCPALAGCASQSLFCAPPSRSMAVAEMMFGRNIGDRPGVSDAAFARFLADSVTPRFPDGLTVIDARGQWKDAASGRLVREPSKLVLLTFRDDAANRAALEAIAADYKRAFAQQAVLTSVRSSCVSY